MAGPIRSSNLRKPNDTMRIAVTTFFGVVIGFLLGLSFPSVSLPKMNIPNTLLPSVDLTYIEDRYSGLSTQAWLNAWSTWKGRKVGPSQAPEFNEKFNETSIYKGRKVGPSQSPKFNETHIWVNSNPRGAESLPPSFIHSESDFYLRRLWGNPEEDFTRTPRCLVTFTVGYEQRANIDACVKKFPEENFTILLFHYDGRTSEWDEFEWSKRAIHVSAAKQTKWWYAKRFLHPDIVAPYDYIFIWDEDLGVEHFNAEEYLKLVVKHGLEISQPGLEPNKGLTWQMTKRRGESEVHKVTDEKPGWCADPLLPPCAAFIEIMAPVFSRSSWRCVWHMIQNDLVHGWGLDFALRRCVEPAHEKIGVIDSQWIVHQTVPSLGNQGRSENGKAPWEGVRDRCRREWKMFQDRLDNAEKSYYEALGYTYHPSR